MNLKYIYIYIYIESAILHNQIFDVRAIVNHLLYVAIKVWLFIFNVY